MNNKSRPSVWWRIARFLAFLCQKYFKNKIVKNTDIDSSQNYLILCRHGSGFDLFHTISAVRPLRFTIIAARKLFFSKLLGTLLNCLKAIPKKQFSFDYSAMKQIKNAVDSGNNIFICPEGRSTPDGKTSFISPAISKLIKWLDLPVLYVNPQGSYLSFPRWFKRLRRGKMITEVDLLLTREQISSLTNQQLYDKIMSAFTFNEYDFQIKNNIKYKTYRPAKNIHRMLFLCPACKAETMVSSNRYVKCTSCNLIAKVQTSGHLSFILQPTLSQCNFTRIDEWIDFERNAITDAVCCPDFRLTLDTKMYFEHEKNKSYTFVTHGTLTFDKSGVNFCPAPDGQGRDIFYPAASLQCLSYGTSYLELYSDDKTQKYKFESHVVTYKLNLIVEAIFNQTL